MAKNDTISTRPGQNGQASSARSYDSASVSFGAVALGMGWQLAVIVLVPIITGYLLDQRFGSTPLWTLIGVVLAMGGSLVVIRRSLTLFGNFNPPASSAAQKKPADQQAGSTKSDSDKELPL